MKNIWNPTVVKLATQYGIDTTMYALWPLFKKELLDQAILEYENDPIQININKYENKNDRDTFSEPLPLAYSEMFKAVKNGCRCIYGALNEAVLKQHLNKNALIQITIYLHKMYGGKSRGLHSILVYDYNDTTVLFHDPFSGPSLTC